MDKKLIATDSLRSLEKYLVIGLLLWAFIIRVYPLFVYGQYVTYHSGGLFYAFIESIRENNFALPISIPGYTYGDLPFAYPPLAFYIVAIVEEIFGSSPKTIIFINPILSFMSIVVFSFAIYKSNLTAFGKYAAIACYATLSLTLREHLPGEGLAESLGSLTLTILLFAILIFDNNPSFGKGIFVGCVVGTNIISSPGTAYAAPVILSVYFIYKIISSDRFRFRTLLFYFAVAIICTILITIPYLIHIKRSLGFYELWEAFSAQHGPNIFILILYNVFLFDDYFPIWQSIGLIGLVFSLRNKLFFWPFLLILLAAIPREGSWLIAIPISILVGYAVMTHTLIIRNILGTNTRYGNYMKFSIFLLLILIILIPLIYAGIWIPASYIFSGSKNLGNLIYSNYVTDGEATYLYSMRTTTPTSDNILIVGNENEWAPLLSQRTILNVLFGTEWDPGKSIAINEYNYHIEESLTAEVFIEAIYLMNEKYPHFFPIPDKVYFSKYDEFPRQNPIVHPQLVMDLHNHGCFETHFENEDVVVFSLNFTCLNLQEGSP